MDNLTKQQRHKNMQNIRSKNTLPELILMRTLQKKKICFSKHIRSLPGTPDIVFKKKKVAIFVDSEFWHGHPTKFTEPRTNKKFWKKKIERNRTRDKKVNRLLKKQGWKVIRLWAADVIKDPNGCIQKINHKIKKI